MKLITKIPVFSKFVPKISQILFKILLNLKQNLPKTSWTFSSPHINLHFFEFWENFYENLLKILINYLETVLSLTNNYSEIFSKIFKIFSV